MSGGLVVFVLLARYLGPEVFGLLNFSLAFVGIFLALVLLGMKDIVIRDLVYENDTRCEILGSALFLSFVFSIFCYIFVVVGIHILRPLDPQSISLVTILGLCVFFKPFEVLSFWFEYQIKARYYVLARNISFVIFSSLKVYMLLASAEISWIASAIVGEACLTSCLLVYFFQSQTNLLNKLRIAKSRITKLAKDCWPILLSSMAIILYMRVDQIMLGQLSSDKEVGLYSAAARVSEVWYFIPTILVVSVFPRMLEIRESSYARYKYQFQALLDFLLLISMPVIAFFFFFGEPFISYLFGQEFSLAGSVLVVNIWASIPVFLGVASSRWLIAEGLQKIILFKTVIIFLANVAMNFILIPKFGAFGAALATVSCHFFGVFVLDVFFPSARELWRMKCKSMNFVSGFIRLTHFKNN